jgi:hypothetical protein
MGTTQRLSPGVPGEPNWGKLSGSITSIANTVGQEQSLAKEIEKAMDKVTANPTQANKSVVDGLLKRQWTLSKRKSQHFRTGINNLVRTGGGRSKIAKGKSPSLGRAGISRALKLSGFISYVHDKSLDAALKKIGFGSVRGKSLSEVIDFLMIYFADTSSGMDEVAANMASCQVLELLAQDATTVEEFEANLNSLIDEEKLGEIMCTFYGLYLFEHLSQRFEEKLTQLKGEAVSAETFKTIKEDILGQIKVIHSERSITGINWKSGDGKAIQEKIFDSIIKLFE